MYCALGNTSRDCIQCPLTRNGLNVHLITSLIYNILSTDVFGMYCALGNTSRGCVQCPSDKEWVDCTLIQLSYI